MLLVLQQFHLFNPWLTTPNRQSKPPIPTTFLMGTLKSFLQQGQTLRDAGKSVVFRVSHVPPALALITAPRLFTKRMPPLEALPTVMNTVSCSAIATAAKHSRGLFQREPGGKWGRALKEACTMI